MFQLFQRLTFLSILSFSLVAPAALKETMQTIGSEFRQVSIKSKDPALKAETLVHIQNLKAAFLTAKTQYPEMVDALPADQQGPARIPFEELIQNGVVASDELTSAVEGGRTSDIAAILTKLTDLRRIGHGEFQ